MPADEESYFLTRKSAKSIDNASIQEFGCTGVELMERAAEGAVGVALEMSRPESKVLILAGPGNNGGDGWGDKVPTQGQVRRWGRAAPTTVSTHLTCGPSSTSTLAKASRPHRTNSDDANDTWW